MGIGLLGWRMSFKVVGINHFRGMDCVFCQSNQEQLVWQDDEFKVIRDIAPKSTTHWLLIPKQHHANIKTLTKADLELVKRMKERAEMLFKEHGKVNGVFGFHVPPFTSIDHLHLHMLEKPFTSVFGYVLFPSFRLWFKPINCLISELDSN